MSLIAVAAVAAVGVGSAYLSAKGKSAALKKQAGALGSLEMLDIDELKKLGAETDIERFRKQFEVQREEDPVYAAIRDRGGQNIFRGLVEDARGDSLADRSLRKLESNQQAGSEDTESLIADLIDRAKADLDAGATLPPEFQAELVRSGLEGAGTSGLSIEGRGAAGTGIRRLLGSEGLALKERREAGALKNLTAAEQLIARRAKELSDFISLDTSLRDAKVRRGAAGAALATDMVPNVGISGADAINMEKENLNMANQIKLAQGNLAGQKKANQYGMYSSMLSSVGGAVAGGGGGGMGSWIGGLFQTKQPAQNPYAAGPGY